MMFLLSPCHYKNFTEKKMYGLGIPQSFLWNGNFNEVFQLFLMTLWCKRVNFTFVYQYKAKYDKFKFYKWKILTKGDFFCILFLSKNYLNFINKINFSFYLFANIGFIRISEIFLWFCRKSFVLLFIVLLLGKVFKTISK